MENWPKAIEFKIAAQFAPDFSGNISIMKKG